MHLYSALRETPLMRSWFIFSVIFDVDICSYGQKLYANYKTPETANLAQSS